MPLFLVVAFVIVALIAGFLFGNRSGITRGQAQEQEKLRAAHQTADDILRDANSKAEAHSKEVLVNAKEQVQEYRNRIEKDLTEQRQEIKQKEERVFHRETNLDHREDAIAAKEANLAAKEQSLTDRSNNLKEKEQAALDLIDARQAEVERVAMMTEQQAKDLILSETEEKLSKEIAIKLRDAETMYHEKAEKLAQSIILEAIQTNGVDTVQDTSTTHIDLPNDDMKGRIIGKDGRNIKTIEALTGIDLIIDDTPETVVLSGFDPIRREIARLALDSLIKDGRIHPAKIEEAVERARKAMDSQIRDAGEEAIFELGIHDMNPDLIKLVGRLKYRTSYGQNVLKHSLEVARLAGTIAVELGENERLARRAGLLHDIGKAVDHEVEGTHVQIGTELARKYGEKPIVVNAIASHHDDIPKTSVIAEIVQIADGLSAARPGARSESFENYIQRLHNLEEIAMSYDGVSNAFAIQAGREIRVMVEPNKLDDLETTKLSHDISQKIEESLEYPGQIKVTVIREVRATDYAK